MTGPRLDPWSQTPYRPPCQGQHRADWTEPRWLAPVVRVTLIAALVASVVVILWAATR